LSCLHSNAGVENVKPEIAKPTLVQLITIYHAALNKSFCSRVEVANFTTQTISPRIMSTAANRTASQGESRRSFLKKTATLAAAAATPTLLKTPVYGQNQAPSANVAGANSRIVIGVIGAGKQGTTHLKMFKPETATHNIAVGAVCDLYQKHLNGAREFIGLTEKDAYRDHRRLLERKDIDAVLIATVDNWHGQCSLDALDAGKHVYCEKPMTRYAGEGWAVYDKVKATKKVYQCGSQYTADPMIHKVAQWVKDGKLGPLVWAQGS